jgi:hypothetical protein
MGMRDDAQLSRSMTRVIAAFAAIAAALFGWTFERAIQPRVLLTMSTRSRKIGGSITLRSRDTSSDELIARAAGRDPFSIGSVKAESIVVERGPAPRETLRVLGTVVDSAGGSFVLCQLGTAPATLVRIGQKIGDYELSSVNKATAVFTLADGGRVELQVPRAGT